MNRDAVINKLVTELDALAEAGNGWNPEHYRNAPNDAEREFRNRLVAEWTTIRGLLLGPLPVARPEGAQWEPPEGCVAWPVEDLTLIWAECEHKGEVHKVPFWIAPGTLIAGHPNMLRKAGAVQPEPVCAPQQHNPSPQQGDSK